MLRDVNAAIAKMKQQRTISFVDWYVIHPTSAFDVFIIFFSVAYDQYPSCAKRNENISDHPGAQLGSKLESTISLLLLSPMGTWRQCIGIGKCISTFTGFVFEEVFVNVSVDTYSGKPKTIIKFILMYRAV